MMEDERHVNFDNTRILHTVLCPYQNDYAPNFVICFFLTIYCPIVSSV